MPYRPVLYIYRCVYITVYYSLAHCIEQYKKGNKKPSNAELQKVLITQAKKTKDREWLKEVSSIPLQHKTRP